MVTLDISALLDKATKRPKNLTDSELSTLFNCDLSQLQPTAYALKVKYCGKKVSIRGLIEASNFCAKNCFYCGIRSGNTKVKRYRLSQQEILSCAFEARNLGYASVVIQAGEIESEENTEFYEKVIRQISALGLGVTLSLGEQTDAVYKRWRDAGAVRYLLRIETANREFYTQLHPANHSWQRRVACLRTLHQLGYQVGTGIMCALPNETIDDLVKAIIFYGDIDADMIGMGPYIPHPDTPLFKLSSQLNCISNSDRLQLGLKLIAITRLYLHDVNIAASTALQALAVDGREQGLLAGANVVMPNVTDISFRQQYQLYQGKPAMDETRQQFRFKLEERIHSIGEEIAYNIWADSPHYAKRNGL